jgi:hypothetical protein
MQLTIYKNLNERIGKPTASAPCINYRKPGEKIELDKVVCGELIEGNAIWYRSTAGFYYWSGGIMETNFKFDDCVLDHYSEGDKICILKQLQKQAHAIFKNTVKGYLGCGFGHKNYDSNNVLSLLVYVDQKVSLSDPQLKYRVLPILFFWGVEIRSDVIPLTVARHHYDSAKTRLRDMEMDIPLLIGGGLKNMNKDLAGTRSVTVFRKNEMNETEYFLLGSYHVLLAEFISRNQKEFSGNPDSASFFPLNSEPEQSHNIVEGCYSNDYDYAAIKLEDKNEVINRIDAIPINGFYDFDEIHSLAGKTVVTIGYVSGIQNGKVLSLHNKVTLEPHNQEFENVIFTEMISVPGDSGAPVVEEDSHKLIGFIIGGNEKDTSFVLPFYNLKYDKRFEIL